METSPLLVARNLSKRFSRDLRYNLYYGLLDVLGFGNKKKGERPTLRKQEFWALDTIDLDLFPGEILGVVGANGSGKTSLIRVISNIYPPDFGTIKGREGLKITTIFALGSGMEPLFTGRENTYIKGAIFGMTKAEVDEKIEGIADFSELGSRFDQPFGNYSSGMKARLSYSIAIATNPDVFIIDEALAVGDTAFRAKCFQHLKEYVKQPDKGVIFVSNHIKKVLKIATRILVMDQGKVTFNSTDIKLALNFYVNNIHKSLSKKEREKRLEEIGRFEY